MEAAQPAQAATTGAQATPVGELDRVGIAHHHVLDVAAAIDQHADLAPDLTADLGQLPRELLREQPVGGNAAPEEALELANLTGLEAVRLAKDLDGWLLTAGPYNPFRPSVSSMDVPQGSVRNARANPNGLRP